MMRQDSGSGNREILEAVAHWIKPLLGNVVFVGGHLAELLVTQRAWVRPRATNDVDVVVRATTRSAYQQIEVQLRGLGLRNDTRPNAPICRWLTPEGFMLDVMPVDEDVLGFTNRWYRLAVETAVEIPLGDELVIRGINAPVFLATKWEAFGGRGEGDIFGSHDLEDIITVTAGRSTIVEEVRAAPTDVRRWIAESTSAFLAMESAEYAVEGALPYAARVPGLLDEVMSRFHALASMK